MRKLFIATLTSLLLLPGVASAQTPTNDAANVDQIRQSYRIHVGPLYINPTLLLKEVGVDSNVFNQAGEQKSDFTTTFTPQADIALTFARRGLLKATVGSDLVYYQKYATERSIDPQVKVRGEAYAHRLTLFAEGAYLNTRQRPNYEIDIRSRHVEQDAQAGAALRLTPKLSIELAARRAEARYDADAVIAGTNLRETLNRSTQGLTGAVRHRLTPLTTLSVQFDRLADTFT